MSVVAPAIADIRNSVWWVSSQEPNMGSGNGTIVCIQVYIIYCTVFIIFYMTKNILYVYSFKKYMPYFS